MLTNEEQKDLYKRISNLESDKKKLEKRLHHYESNGTSAIGNISKANEKAFKIALRRKFPKFDNKTQFVKWCIKQATGYNFKELCDFGRETNYGDYYAG